MSSTQSDPSSPRLSLICPTIGRSTFASLLADVQRYIGPEDEFITVGDGPCPHIRAQVEALNDPRFRYLEVPVRASDYGCTPCDLGIANAKGDMVWFVGDDDQVASHVYETIRAKVVGATDKVHIFSMKHTGVIFKNSITFTKVSGQQIVLPREHGPRMADFPEQDFFRTDWSFISRATGKFGEPIYHEDLICILPNMNQGAML